MKKIIFAAIACSILCMICGCSDNSVQSRFTDGYVEKWFDYYHVSVFYDEVQTIKLAEFPNVVFHCDRSNVTAESGRYETVMFSGNPVDAVYLSDLTGDGLPEFCSMVCIGYGIIDERIIVYDYVSKTEYKLSDRFRSNYFLTLEDGSLIATQVPFEGETVSGKLALLNGELAME